MATLAGNGDELFRVGADVSDGPADPGASRVRSPARLLVARRFQLAGQPALVVLDDDLADLAELTLANHLPLRTTSTRHLIATIPTRFEPRSAFINPIKAPVTEFVL